MSKSSNWESTIKPIVVLSVISLIASLLLALVNGMTAPVIAENTKRTTLAAYVGRHHRRGQDSGRQHCNQGRGKGL